MKIERTVHGAVNEVDNMFQYSLIQDSSNPAIINGLSNNFWIAVSGTPDTNGDVTSTGGVHLTDAVFPALGDYKFVVREIDSEDPVNYPIDSEKEYYFYVSVRNKLDGDGRPTNEYIATMAEQVRNHDTGDKTNAVFESAAQRNRIEVTNTVSGNLANVNDYFKYKVVINGAREGDNFMISGQDSVVNYNGASITTGNTITVGGEDDYIYLKHGQTVYIGYDGNNNQLPIGVKYSIEEVDANGYTQYVDGIAGNVSETKTISAEIGAPSNKVDFLNHKEGNVLTGIVTNATPYVLAFGVAGMILAIVHVNRKKQRKTKCSK